MLCHHAASCSFISKVSVFLALYIVHVHCLQGGPEQLAPRGKLVLCAGLGTLLMVPLFRTVTGLPPYMGMLAGLGFLWLLTDAIHFGETKR